MKLQKVQGVRFVQPYLRRKLKTPRYDENPTATKISVRFNGDTHAGVSDKQVTLYLFSLSAAVRAQRSSSQLEWYFTDEGIATVEWNAKQISITLHLLYISIVFVYVSISLRGDFSFDRWFRWLSLVLFSDSLLPIDRILSKVCWFSDDWTADKRIGGSYLRLTSQRSITDRYLSDGNYQATTKNRRPRRLKPQTANRPTQINFPPEILGQWLFPSHLNWLNYSSDNKIRCFLRLPQLLFTDGRVHFTQLYWGCG